VGGEHRSDGRIRTRRLNASDPYGVRSRPCRGGFDFALVRFPTDERPKKHGDQRPRAHLCWRTTYSGCPLSAARLDLVGQVCTLRLAHGQFCICLLTDRQIAPTTRARPFYHHPFQAFLSRKSSRRSHSTHFSTRISGRSPKRGIVVTRVNGRPQVGQRRRSCSFITFGAC
jgi:hypothetical protein